MQPSSADAVKRVLTMAGVTGAALTLSAAAALPAFAGHTGDSDGNGNGNANGNQSTASSHSQDAHDQSSDHHDATSDGDDGGAAKDDNAQGGGASKNGGDNAAKPANGDDGHNPAGNNGTVKIHQAGGDSSPHNVPHVSCSFFVSFFGFDSGQPMNVSFAGQAPTGKDAPIAIKDSTLTSKTSTTDAGGAGNDYDGDLGKYDATNLDLSGLGTPSKQGFHIKLDVATGEPGGHKYKVFWFTPCGTTDNTQNGGNDNGGQLDTTPPSNTTPTVTGSTTGGATVLGESLTRTTTPTVTTPAATTAKPTTTKVLGESLTRRPTATTGLASLPFTGAETAALMALGLGALGGGAALTVAGRRRKAAARA